MKLRYELSPEDYVALGDYGLEHFPESRREIRTAEIVGGVVAVALFGIVWYFTSNPLWIIAGFGLAAAWSWWWRRYVVVSTRKYMREQAGPCAQGHHSLEAHPNGLSGSCDVLDTTVKWEGVEDVAITDSHVYVFLSDGRAYVVPKHRILEGDIAAFVHEVKHYCGPSSAPN